jgi:hypothetical protein
MTKEKTHKIFIDEFYKFLKVTAIPGSILTTSIIKKWIRSLDDSHPLIQSYITYREGSLPLKNDDYNLLVANIKHLPGYYQVSAYQRRVGYGSNVQVVNVKRNKIKI